MEEEKRGTGANATENRNIYRRGADDGLWLGLYLTVIFALMVASVSHPAFNIPGLGMMLGVPFLTYYYLRRTHVDAHGMTSFSALWMQGIVMFGCGCLIFCLLAFVYMRWINPGFINGLMHMAIDSYNQSDVPQAQQLAADFQSLLDNHLVPTPLQLVLGWLWLGMFSGSLLSMIVAVFVRVRRVPLS